MENSPLERGHRFPLFLRPPLRPPRPDDPGLSRLSSSLPSTSLACSRLSSVACPLASRAAPVFVPPIPGLSGDPEPATSAMLRPRNDQMVLYILAAAAMVPAAFSPRRGIKRERALRSFAPRAPSLGIGGSQGYLFFGWLWLPGWLGEPRGDGIRWKSVNVDAARSFVRLLLAVC